MTSIVCSINIIIQTLPQYTLGVKQLNKRYFSHCIVQTGFVEGGSNFDSVIITCGSRCHGKSNCIRICTKCLRNYGGIGEEQTFQSPDEHSNEDCKKLSKDATDSLFGNSNGEIS